MLLLESVLETKTNSISYFRTYYVPLLLLYTRLAATKFLFAAASAHMWMWAAESIIQIHELHSLKVL